MSNSSNDFIEVAAEFSKQNLFWPPAEAASVLDITSLPPETSLIDIGCGRNDIVKFLREKGFVNIVGIDFAGQALDKDSASPASLFQQRPQIAAYAEHLPFKDDAFDIAVSFYGGLSYPLLDLEFSQNYLNPEWTKKAVLSFLSSLKEALRVAKEVRLHPWSLHPLFDQTGLVGFYSNLTSEIAFLPIDFHKLCQEAGITLIRGAVSPRPAKGVSSALHYETMILKKTSHFNFQPLDKLIKKVSQEGVNFITTRNLGSEYKPFNDALRNFLDVQGRINQFNEYLYETTEDPRKEDWQRTLIPIFRDIALKEYGINLDDPNKTEAFSRFFNFCIEALRQELNQKTAILQSTAILLHPLIIN